VSVAAVLFAGATSTTVRTPLTSTLLARFVLAVAYAACIPSSNCHAAPVVLFLGGRLCAGGAELVAVAENKARAQLRDIWSCDRQVHKKRKAEEEDGGEEVVGVI